MKTTISPSLHDGVLQGTFGDVSRDVIERTATIGGLYKKVLGASVAPVSYTHLRAHET